MPTGTLTTIHRYPFKSMLGETLESTHLVENGIPGDRAWAIRDEVRGGIQGAKKLPQLMSCAARYLSEPEHGAAPAPEVTLPGVETLLASDADAASRFGEVVGREVTIWPLLPADALDHYRRAAPDDPDMLQELRAIFGREPDEPLPDIGKFPPEIMQFESPPGTYFDAFPLLLMTERSIASLAAVAPGSVVDARRFRPNLLISTESDEAFPELAWIGKTLRIGDARISVAMECPRCVMTTHGFADIPKDPGVMRSLVRHAEGNLGVYAQVESGGPIRTGDTVEVLG